ncbi:MAG: acyl-CoA/acyl-ACP dehydrogenase [Micrococcales bacterium]|nr:acyl-CoA/acyl-ACP dehydrogenase [Micrococcales bacterium]
MTAQPTADLLYTPDEEDLRRSVRKLLSQKATPEANAAVYDQPLEGVAPVWGELAGVGLAALLVPEEHGGAGATAREAAIAAEELGRNVAPTPFLTSAVIATTVLAHAGATDRLEALAAGESVAALALPFSARTLPAPSVTADGGRLSGRITSVAGAPGADLLIVPVVDGATTRLHLVDVGSEGVTVTPVLSLDMTRQLADIELTGAAGEALEGDASAAVEAGLLTGAALLASEQLGVAEWCLETTLDYAKTRHQFGRPIGSYQALKHRFADLFLDVSLARAAARYAADCAARGDADLAVAASVAQSFCSAVSVKAAEECVQLHGGIGMTWEYPAHLYLKRAKADQVALGTGAAHRAALGGLVGLPPA